MYILEEYKLYIYQILLLSVILSVIFITYIYKYYFIYKNNFDVL